MAKSIKSKVDLHDRTQIQTAFDYFLDRDQDGNITANGMQRFDLEAYFFDVFQDFDHDRVYSSDIKKIIQWYNLLLDFGKYNFGLTEEEKPSTNRKN